MTKTPQQHFSTFATYFIPIIIVSKIIRWTIMKRVLILMSIGFGMIERMNAPYPKYFRTAFANFDAGGSSGVAASNAEYIFSTFNFLGIQTYIGWEIYFTILFNLVFFFLVKRFYQTTPNINWRHNVFIYMAIAILNIFCFNMSKEPYQLIFFILMSYGMIYAKGFKAKNYWVMFVIFLNILFARKYFILILAFFVATQYIVSHNFKNLDTTSSEGRKLLLKRIMGVFVVLAIFHFVMFRFIAGASEESYDTLVSVNDRDQNRSSVATSEIVPIFGSSNQLFVTLEFFAKIFRLSFPVELLIIGKFTYILIIIFQVLLAGFLIKAFASHTKANEDIEEDEEEDEEEETEEESLVFENEIENTDKKEFFQDDIEEDDDEEEEEEDNEEEEEEIDVFKGETLDRRQTRIVAMYFYIAFLLCSACFEPDFGSWTRHMGVVFPMILFIM